MKTKPKISLSTTQIILLSFLPAILAGSLLLALPISAKNGIAIPYTDALFTATTATCVTGLVTLPIATTFSLFGQIVILVLIQVGGLGIITVMAGFTVILHRKLGLRESRLIGDAFNLASLSDLSGFVKRVFIGTAIVEGIGALLYMTVFIPDFGIAGIWISVFTSVSAFCNAGIDIIADNSLCDYTLHPVVNGVTMLLIVMGGIGYIVWWDVLRIMKQLKRRGLSAVKQLTLHTKIVLLSTAALILLGTLFILLFEYQNPLTIGNLSFFHKLQVSLFQSVTTRTAGFATVPQQYFTDTSSILCLFLMFIGGSPVGTAGGIKTATVAVLLATAFSTIRNKNEVSLLNRNLSREITRKAVAVTVMSSIILFCSTLALSVATSAPALDVVYETVSATATVGLTRGITPLLNVWGKWILIATMYFGRIGPISLAIAFQSKKKVTNSIKNPTEDISVG